MKRNVYKTLTEAFRDFVHQTTKLTGNEQIKLTSVRFWYLTQEEDLAESGEAREGYTWDALIYRQLNVDMTEGYGPPVHTEAIIAAFRACVKLAIEKGPTQEWDSVTALR